MIRIFDSQLSKLQEKQHKPKLDILEDIMVKKYDDKGKERISRENWKKIYKISDEENLDFDVDNELLVADYLIQNEPVLKPKPKTDYITPLQTESNLVTTDEIKQISHQKLPTQN